MDEDNITANITAVSNNRLLQTSNTVVENLYKKYENDLYMISKIHHYISHQLPLILENIEDVRDKNKLRNIEHQDEQDKFMSRFLSQHKYYYNAPNEKFYTYNGRHYKETTEDDILHHIVSTISDERNPVLMNWKHKTKVSLLKRIKEQSITKTIPESDTIQTVLQYLCPMFFPTKTETKYFLTVIGDNILRKHSNLIHYISPVVKQLMTSLNSICMEKFNVQCIQTIKYKYHEKQQENDCRLVRIQSHINADSLIEKHNKIVQYSLDLLCVACHYSHKYGSADDYLLDYSQDTDLQEYVLRLKHKTPKDIINHFSQLYLYNVRVMEPQQIHSISYSPQEELFLQQTVSQISNHSLSWKHIQYLWKEYLELNQYPMSLFHHLYKQIFIEQIYPGQYNTETDSFQDIGSSQTPLIQKFLKFWEETAVEDTNSYSELETEEVSLLFRNWLSAIHSNPNNSQKKKKYLLKENKIIDILTYFYPDLEIVDGKYILHMRNVLWDKDMDIETVLTYLKEEKNSRINSLYSAYQYYTKYYSLSVKTSTKPLLVSKSYFEKYIQVTHPEIIDENDTLKEKWYEL